MNIEFWPSSKEHETVEPPQPARDHLPKWYSDTAIFRGGKPQIERGAAVNLTVKSCGPFADALSHGYIQRTWCDIWIEDTGNGIAYNFSRHPAPMAHRDNPQMERRQQFYDSEFVWIQPWVPKTPKGYSILITNPLNREDLPFVVSSGIVDSDVFYHAHGGSVPFWIRRGFTGMIPFGTPMYQIIPFRRDDWTSKAMPFDEDRQKKLHAVPNEKFWGVYRQRFQQRKSFK